MKIKTDEPKRKYQWTKCEVCGKRKRCTWHHIAGRRYSDEWIWACVFNGYAGGCHEKIHANPEWAYNNNYLKHHNHKENMKKTKKTKQCKHTSTYYSSEKADFICQFCRKVVGELRMGGKKKKKDPKKLTSS